MIIINQGIHFLYTNLNIIKKYHVFPDKTYQKVIYCTAKFVFYQKGHVCLLYCPETLVDE